MFESWTQPCGWRNDTRRLKGPMAQINVRRGRSSYKEYVVGVTGNRNQQSDRDYWLRVLAGLLLITGRWRLRANFLLLRTDVGVDADIVVCELAHLSIVDTDDLSLL